MKKLYKYIKINSHDLSPLLILVSGYVILLPIFAYYSFLGGLK